MRFSPRHIGQTWVVWDETLGLAIDLGGDKASQLYRLEAEAIAQHLNAYVGRPSGHTSSANTCCDLAFAAITIH